MQPVRLILVEDMPMEAEVAFRQLETGGFTCDWKRVDSEAVLRRALEEHKPDLILSGGERPHQQRHGAHMGCDQSQGYLHSRPLSVADIEPLLKNGSLPASSNGLRHNLKSNQEVTPFAHQG